MFVVDASVTMTWCLADEATKETEQVLDRLRSDWALVPWIWSLEVANVMVIAERRGRLTEAESTHFLALLESLPITIDEASQRSTDAIATARRHGLSAYDASYLNVATREGLPLATLDKALRAAARQAGVPLLID